MKTRETTESHTAMRALAGGMVAALLSVLVYSARSGGSSGFLAVLSVGFLLSGASTLVGGTLGFLFGIPRTLQQEGQNLDVGRSSVIADAVSAPPRIDYRVNTNLEQISDWLTKILVGVGLTQIGRISEGLKSLAAFAAQGLGSQGHGEVFALALLSYSAVLGFLFGYLWTRLFLAGALRLADQASIGALAQQVMQTTAKVETTERKLEELKKQAEQDAAALNMAYRQLNPGPDLPQVSQEELDAAVAAASRLIRVQIFNQAWAVRSANWRELSTKLTMERTIPLFRALVRSDTENRYHMNHGQLGFALKDKMEPDWAEAEKELTIAIQIRGPWQAHGWLFYEFNRAICRIMLDPAFAEQARSEEDRKREILADLRAATFADAVREAAREDPVVGKWMSLNAISEKDLRHSGTRALKTP